MSQFLPLLSGGDLRSISQSNKVVTLVQYQKDFDHLFQFLFHQERLVAMRAADAIEKITISHCTFLTAHKRKLFKLSKQASDKELKWHLALLLARLQLTINELGIAWQILSGWAMDKKESRIVRVNSIQGLFNLLKQSSELKTDFELLLSELEREKIPSLNARIRKLKKNLNIF